MAGTKALVKDSAIYGGSTILVKMVSWLLTTLFTYTLSQGEFGMMTNLYAYVAVIIIILTFGMETGVFRFINQTDKYKPEVVYPTVLILVGAIVLLFLIVFLCFLQELRPFLWDSKIPDNYLRILVIVLSLDAFGAIPFAYLRYKKRPLRFGFLKVLNVIIYTSFCLFFLLLCPWLNEHYPASVSWFWKGDSLLGYVFISNLLATGIQTLCLLPVLTGFRYVFDWSLAKRMLRYCFPLVIMGLAGMSNQVVDKLVFPAVFPDKAIAFDELGIYSGCFKIALIMMMFTQAFRYAYEPFVFEKSRDKDSKRSYADVMKYFVILGWMVFLGVMFYLDIIKYFISPKYFAALPVVPIVLAGELFFAIYYNLSIWYKLTDKTYWGAIFSFVGFVLIIMLNILFIPRYGYMACAWASFAGNLLIMLLSYFIGQKQYPVDYDLKTLFLYAGVALLLYGMASCVVIDSLWLRLAFRTALIGLYVLLVIKRDIPLSEVPYLGRYFGKNQRPLNK
jgi:O-antigen/teichoic acid export membrane protein